MEPSMIFGSEAVMTAGTVTSTFWSTATVKSSMVNRSVSPPAEEGVRLGDGNGDWLGFGTPKVRME